MDHNTDVQFDNGLLLLLVLLHRFYRNQGNFDYIPLIRQSIVQPIIFKIDQVVLPSVLEKLDQQVPGVGDSGILIVSMGKYQC